MKAEKDDPGGFGKGRWDFGRHHRKYERDEIKPSIDTASKIADALGVTLDYLVKDAEYQNIDQDALNRLKLIEKLPTEERSHLFATMDAFFAKNKLQALLK